MRSPFPGMDPFLEHPALWPDVHNRLIAALDEYLAPRLPPRYFLAMEQRVYIAEPDPDDFVGRPDALVGDRGSPGAAPVNGRSSAPAGNPLGAPAEGAGPRVFVAELPVPDRIRETYLEVRDAPTGSVVTLIEVLSPANKRPGRGRSDYERKRARVLASQTHLVEIDLLRAWPPMPMRVRADGTSVPPPGDYRVLVSRSETRPRAVLHVFTVRDALPSPLLPLLSDDEEPVVDLQPIVQGVYDRSRYWMRVDYRRDPVPPLGAEDAAWADELLRAAGAR